MLFPLMDNPKEQIIAAAAAIHDWFYGLRCLSVIAGLILAIFVVGTEASADTDTRDQALRIVRQYSGDYTSPGTWPRAVATPDGPLLGNGDLGVAVLNNIDTLTFVLAKNEFWSLSAGKVKAMASMRLSIPGMAGASFAMQENISNGEVNGQFATGGNRIETASWVQADDTINNRFFTRFDYSGSSNQKITVSLSKGDNNPNPSSSGTTGNVLYFDVAADPAATFEGHPTCRVRIAVSVIGATATIVNGDQLQFTLVPGVPVTLASSIVSNFDTAGNQDRAVSNVASLTLSQVSSFNTTHRSWWADFWARSFVEIPNKTIEKEFYGSLYLLASCSRAGEAPPGLWGNWIRTNPGWNGDYTLNYNYEAPFYASFPTNHVELADSYDAPIINWLPNAETEAQQNGWAGAFYRVHIGPLPSGSADKKVHNQKFNGAYAATVMLMHYYYTRDRDYATAVYPTLRQMAVFWQNYLSWNGKSFDILEDAQQEGDRFPQTNGIMSLGLVRFLLQGVINISAELKVDASDRAIWQKDLNHLSPYPTFNHNGQKVFRWTSVGRDWANGNSIGIQHIYPGSQIGLATDPSELSIARNMINQMQRWSDGNGTVTFYPAAARVGYDPNIILSQLTSWIKENTYPNLHIHSKGGGIENLNTVPSTVTEMLMQSFQGTIRLFADWPSKANARFGNLLAYGNFLVSSSMVRNKVQYVRIVSREGLHCSLLNPWPGQAVQVYRNGVKANSLSGATLKFPTKKAEVLILSPKGTDYATILREIGTPLGPLLGS